MLEGNRAARGFTLIEVALMMLLIAVVAGLAVPSLKHSYSRVLLEKSAGDMVYLIRYAQGRSITFQEAYWIYVDTANVSYGLRKSEGDAKSNRIPLRMAGPFALPKGIVMETESEGIRCFPDGTLAPAEIHFRYRDRHMVVSTRKQVGRVHMFEVKS